MLFLAFRHLLSRKRQTLLTLGGILLGTAGYIVISGLMLGLREFILDQLVNNNAHIFISAREEYLTDHGLDSSLFGRTARVFWPVPPSGRKDSARIQNPQGWYKRLEADPRVFAYSPQLTSHVILTRANATANGTFIGCDPRKREQVTTIRNFMVIGSFSDIAGGGNRLIAGVGLLKKLGARVGTTINVASGRGASVPFKVLGSFRTGIQELDDIILYGDLADVQKINQTPSQVNEIAVRLHNVITARRTAEDWQAITNEKVQSWDQVNANFLSVFRMQDFVRYAIVTVILLVAGFGIYNILSMLVNQKRREIAILRSMGYLPSEIIFLFFTQGLVLGILGSASGCIVGYAACRYLQTLPFNAGLGSGNLMVSFNPSFYITGFAFATAASALASILPARAAGKLTPVEIIRSD